jgi:hypothetical protein
MVNVGPLAPHRRVLDVPVELTADDRTWVRDAMAAVGVDVEFPQDRPGKPPVDTSWITFTTIRG